MTTVRLGIVRLSDYMYHKPNVAVTLSYMAGMRHVYDKPSILRKTKPNDRTHKCVNCENAKRLGGKSAADADSTYTLCT